MGHLFQGRYKAVLVDADIYLMELTRYIHLNPIRAGIVKDPEAIGGARDGGLVNHGTWSMSAKGVGKSDVPGYYDLKLLHEAIADASEHRSEVGKSDARTI